MDINLIFWINAAGIGAEVLALTGYIISVSPTVCTLIGIKAAMTLYLEVCLLIAAIVIGFLYKLTDDKYVQIAQDLDNGIWNHGKIGDQDVQNKNN